jgi:hypothetical protein
MSDEINLGVTPSEKYADEPYSISGPKSEERIIYPTFRYSGPKELDLPEHGDMTIHFRKTMEKSSVDENGEHHYECEIQVRAICDVDEEDDDAPSKSYSEAGDALDKLMKEREESD